MRIAIVTDAWSPQVNGVVRTLQSVTAELRAMDHEVSVLSPDLFASIPCPSYPEIRLALPAPGAVGRALSGFGPDAVHIATEGRWACWRGAGAWAVACPSPPPITRNSPNMSRRG